MNQADLTLDIPGLERPAEIRVDRWGVPHIRAESRHDAFLVQGFNAARDRLWQLDLWRKRGLGLLAGDFGPGYLAQDRASRLFLYRGDEAAEWAAYGTPQARAIAEAFVAGLNAFIGLTEADPSWLPPEFATMGTRPARWDAFDVVRIRSHALTRNALSEVARAQVAARGALALDPYRKALAPDHVPEVPEGLDPPGVPPDVIEVVRLATAGVGFTPARLACPREEAWRWAVVNEHGAVTAGDAPLSFDASPPDGSNNWALAPSRTATGRPILASDPHRAYTLPSLRYVVHLSAPGLDVIGAGEPALPGISIGHNGRAAFSLTISPIDQEDLCVYETHPEDPDLYRYGDGWEGMRRIEERILVRGGPDEIVHLAFTRHGPVLWEDRVARRAFALRTVWSEPGTAAYLGSLAYLDAASPEDFGAALRHWSAPSVNQVYADVSGRIAWFVAGKAPRRPNWDGLMPVPGDGRYEWDGFVGPEDLPRAIDPPGGIVASANEMNLPPGYPHAIGYEWHEPWRALRIAAVLDGQPRHALADSAALQGDDLSLPALRLARLASGALAGEGDLGAALALLVAFDGHLHEDSAAAALAEIWWVNHLRPGLLRAVAPDAATETLLAPGDTETLLALLEAPRPPLGREARDALLAETLAAAFRDGIARLGPDPQGWRWGRLHQAHFLHPLSGVGFAGHDIGPLPVGGSGVTVMNTGYRTDTFRLTTGASFRMVVDVGNWDASLFINGPGQSGDPRSPHYADHAEPWSKRAYRPLLYSREAVDAATMRVIRLRPRRRPVDGGVAR
ncbi:penicillin acylase family protein [Methylobacterium nodulans]|uniref:Peptidase S45 penicillin amidase n=1 Tax=Methylobacterium nodulans (strain LMG 21967 / CNCM I-2342 / ORS 2060) TaxID=460265 RepID=B8IFQ8_METNO|nr:penicillin acylase family protein [Methylobacterium nodulans]ACL59618.1 peptidase S45 penicillin amidase [Methylobacterium nodulans ORS 2060]